MCQRVSASKDIRQRRTIYVSMIVLTLLFVTTDVPALVFLLVRGKMEQDQTRLNGSLLGAAQHVSSGRPPLINDDSRFVLPGRGSTAPVRTWPGLHIRRKWRVSSPNEEPQILDVDCRVKECEMSGGSLFL